MYHWLWDDLFPGVPWKLEGRKMDYDAVNECSEVRPRFNPNVPIPSPFRGEDTRDFVGKEP
jgi:hypothetical protein